MRAQIIKLRFLLVIVFTVLVVACSSETDSGRAILVLFDLSGTVDGAERDEFRNYFNKVMDSAEGGDSIMVVKIDASPSGGPILVASEQFETYSPMKNSRELKANEKASRTRLSESVDKMLADTANSTPILDTLFLSQRLLDSTGAAQRYIVIMSDMVEESRVANFTKRKMDDADIESLLANLVGNGRMPSFEGAIVYVAGARQSDMDRALRTQRFWDQYFTKAGAVFDPNKYGAELIRFP